MAPIPSRAFSSLTTSTISLLFIIILGSFRNNCISNLFCSRVAWRSLSSLLLIVFAIPSPILLSVLLFKGNIASAPASPTPCNPAFAVLKIVGFLKIPPLAFQLILGIGGIADVPFPDTLMCGSLGRDGVVILSFKLLKKLFIASTYSPIMSFSFLFVSVILSLASLNLVVTVLKISPALLLTFDTIVLKLLTKPSLAFLIGCVILFFVSLNLFFAVDNISLALFFTFDAISVNFVTK